MTHRLLIMATAATTLALLPTATLLAQVPVQMTSNAQQPAPPRSVIQKLRAFLGVNPPVAVGGSRSGGGGGQSICLLSPWPSPERTGNAVPVTVVVSRPVLLAAGQLNEIRLEKGGRILWQERASSTQPIEGSIPWPIKPLQPGEQLTLKLRPRGASGGDFATYVLRAADAPVLEANERQAKALGNDPKVWNGFVEQLKPQQAGLVAGLLSSPQAPVSLRQNLQCSER